MSEVCVCVYVSESTKNIYLFEPSKPKLFSVDSSEEGRFHNPQRWRNKVWKHLKLSSTWVFTFCLCLCIAVPPFPPLQTPSLPSASQNLSLWWVFVQSFSRMRFLYLFMFIVFSLSSVAWAYLRVYLFDHIDTYLFIYAFMEALPSV